MRNGVGIGNADLIFMPLTPKLAAVPLIIAENRADMDRAVWRLGLDRRD